MVQHGGSARSFTTIGPAIVLAIVVAAGCSKPAPPPAEPAKPPADPQHAGITTPHGDHTPHHNGMVLMNGDYHYEVVFDRGGRHHIWFSDAVREELPASLASKVMMVVTRKTGAPESLALAIDDSGESWVAAGQPVIGDDVMVKVSYELRGAPFEVEIPFVAPR
ncbi:MAG: hypothetical protein ABI665_05395 [Vicinamibacterales bacterium]